MKHLFLAITLISTLVFTSCEGDKINIFSLQQDVEMGEKVVNQILSDPVNYPVLNPETNKAAYDYLNKIKEKLLKSGEIKYAEQFAWNIFIIDQDVMNAFAVPGGTTFYYTGLLKYLDNEASLAGVMAHEFAHADKRHSTTVLTKLYGFQTLLGMLLGNDGGMAITIASELAQGLGNLKFSRENEYEADEWAVKYLSKTDYDPRGVAYFFEKMTAGEKSNDPGWLVYFQTHPNPEDRIKKIYDHAGSKGGKKFEDEYVAFKKLLP